MGGLETPPEGGGSRWGGGRGGFQRPDPVAMGEERWVVWWVGGWVCGWVGGDDAMITFHSRSNNPTAGGGDILTFRFVKLIFAQN